MADHNLAEGSKSYHSEADIYERFSQAEDYPQKIISILKPLIAGKDVLDIGCGTGKYLVEFAPLSNSYYGLDISPEQLMIAKSKSIGMNLANVSFICSSAEKIDLPDNSIDAVISAWVVGTIQGIDRRASAISEAERILKKDGSIYLIENDIGGEFETIRGRYPDIARTMEYNSWLEHDMGFAPLARFTTNFKFSSADEAKHVIGSIWGQAAGEMVKDRTIGHNIIIYHLRKSELKGTSQGGMNK
jgi:ubiquinone/menaquinone biosynthesis C-methylase UbiE